jgi:hypothetical protein
VHISTSTRLLLPAWPRFATSRASTGPISRILLLLLHLLPLVMVVSAVLELI